MSVSVSVSVFVFVYVGQRDRCRCACIVHGTYCIQQSAPTETGLWAHALCAVNLPHRRGYVPVHGASGLSGGE
jgi:hypothetical protein